MTQGSTNVEASSLTAADLDRIERDIGAAMNKLSEELSGGPWRMARGLATDARALLVAAREARAWVLRLTAQRVLTCVYCGDAFPPGTADHGAEVLTAHVRSCTKHPMRDLEIQVGVLSASLDAAHEDLESERARAKEAEQHLASADEALRVLRAT